ncbi:glycosyltransferase BC10-like [Aristolochia californica]|uniref:glycosyltransferase BC10-like n=1 Tax=Aristolochia californica TaxID=171875 RepID=UPI0035DC98C4
MKKDVEEITMSSVREKEVSSTGSRRELRALVFLSLAFAVTCLLVSFQARKLILTKEIFFPQMDKFEPVAGHFSHLCNKTGSASAASNLSDRTEAKQVWHSMTEEELLWRASLVPHDDYPYPRTPKVAFMFLAKGRMPMGPIWQKFFEGHRGLFSVYLHTTPEYEDDTPETSVFFRRRIPSKPVEWGKVTMIDAERRLLANALLDFSNERFVLLSESCIPLFNFTTIYNYLIHSNHSFLGSFDDPRAMGRGRYNKRMWPTVTIHDWRKGSQWFEVNRKLALEIVSDRKYYPLFRDHCKPSCYVDEHYLPTLVTKLFPELNSRRSITWVDWSAGGSHPKSFGRKDITEKFVNQLRFGSMCSYNGKNSSVCFLFARKFLAGALEPLLRILPALLGF